MDIDSGTEAKLSQIYPDLKVRVIRVYNDFYNRHQKKLFTIEGVRDLERQAKLWAQGRTSPGKIVTRARPGDSIHNYGLAFDSGFMGADPYLEALKEKDIKSYQYFWGEFGRFAKAHGLKWGGDWNGNGIQDKEDWDLAHAEITYGLTLAQIKKLHAVGGLKAVWVKCDQIRGVEVGSEWKHLIKL